MPYHDSYLHRDAVGCRDNPVQCKTIFHSALNSLKPNINSSLNSQSALHTSPLRASYGVFLWRFWRKLTTLAAKQRSVIFVTNSVEHVCACINACIVVFEIWCAASSIVCMIICCCQSNVLKHVIHVHVLTHWGRVNHICVSQLSHHWFRKWLVARSVPSHYLSHCWYTMNWI